MMIFRKLRQIFKINGINTKHRAGALNMPILSSRGLYTLLLLFAYTSSLSSFTKTYQLACRYYETNSSSQQSNFLHPGLPWLWARGENDEYIQVLGDVNEGFFDVSQLKDLKSAKIYENSKKRAMRFCQLALEKAFSSSGSNTKRVLEPIVKESFLSLTSFSPVFQKNHMNSGPLTKMVIFGDSLSDDGNLKNWLRVFPPEPYFAGRFSNGPIWVDYFKQVAGIAVQNWAVGGSLATPHNDPEVNKMTYKDKAIMSVSLAVSGNVKKEISRFQASLGPRNQISDPSSTMFALWIGGNDYLTWLSSKKDADIFIDAPEHPRAGFKTIANQVVKSIGEHLSALYSLGARKFFVVNLPNLGIAPKVLENESYHLNKAETANQRLFKLSSRLTELSQFHNQLLKEELAAFSAKNPDAQIIDQDSFYVLERGLDTISPYQPICLDQDYAETISYKNQTAKISLACMKGLKNPKVCNAPNQKIFWDNIHPSSFVHCLMAMNIHQNMAEQGSISAVAIGNFLGLCQGDQQEVAN